MPGPLQFKQADPNNLGRGSGWYYHRGRGIYSKYSKQRDATIIKGPRKIGSGSYRHTEDYSSFKRSPIYPTQYPSYKKSHNLRPETIKRNKKVMRWKPIIRRKVR